MKDIIAIALLGALFVGSAFAVGENRWSHPEGLYSIDVTGWRAIGVSGAEGELQSFEPTGWQRGMPVRLCAVRTNPRAGPQFSQAELNERGEAFAPTQRDGEAVEHSPSRLTDGVRVLAYSITDSQSITQWRMFALASPDGATLHQVWCGGAPPLSDAERAANSAFLDSIRFSHVSE